MAKGIKKIEDYTISRKLEESNFALIYRAQDKDGKDIVLKVAKEAKPDLNELISREFQILSQFQHPNIVSVYDYGVTNDGRAYFTQEYIPDKPLHECFTGFSEEFLAAIIQVINALGAFHDKGFIHCDLKPEHILYNKEKQRAVLIDFGFAQPRLVEAGTPTQDVHMAGTLGYMAPEVLKGVGIDQRSDLYSLGVIIYEILAGKQLTDPYELINDIPDDINKALARLVSKEPLLRPNALELFQVLQKHITSIEVAEPLHKVNLPETGFVEIPEIAERIASSKGEALVITGDTGTGKTRHLQELKYKYLMQGYAVLYHTAKERTTFSESIQNFIGLTELGLKEIENKFQIFETINQELLKFAADKTIVILIDGLEDLSDYGLQLFRYIGYGIKDANIVLIGTAQPEQRIKDLGFDVLELRPFTKDETQTLFEKTFFAIADTKKTAQNLDFAEWLHKQSGGNPLYIVEILKSLYEQNILHYKANQWQIASDKLKEIKLPAKLDGLLEARLSALNERPLKILKILSVADCPLDVGVLTDILGADVRVDIEHLKSLGFLREESVGSKRLLNIPNQILTQIVARGIDKEEKQLLSKSLIEPLEIKVLADDNYLPVLARLYDETDDIEKAYDYFKRAAEKAKEMYDYASAISCFEKLANYSRTIKPDMYYEMHVAIADLQRATGKNHNAFEKYQEALHTKEKKLLFRIYSGLGAIHSDSGDDDDAINSFITALSIQDENTSDYIYSANNLGYIYARQSRFKDAEKIFEKSLQLSRELHDSRAQADTLYYTACVEWFRNAIDAGLKKAKELMEFAQANELSKLAGLSSNLLSSFYASRNDIEKAQEYLDIAVKIFIERKNVDAVCGALSTKVLLHMAQGQFLRAKTVAEDALFLSEQLNVKNLEFVNTANLAAIYHALGDLKVAYRLGTMALSIEPDAVLSNFNLAMVFYKRGDLDKAYELLKKKNTHRTEALYCIGLALVHVARDETEFGERMINEGHSLIKSQQIDTSHRVDALLTIAQYYVESPHFEDSLSFSESVLNIAHNRSREYNIADVFRALSTFNQGKTERIEINTQIKRLKKMGCLYDYAYVKRLAIDALMDKNSEQVEMKHIIEDVTEIKEIFESIGANLELERTKKLQEKLFPLIVKDYSQRIISTQYLDTFSNLAELINSHLGDTGFTQNLLDLLVQTTGVERGALFIKTGRTMRFVAGRNIDQETINDARALSRTVVNDITKNRIVFTQNALSDPNFSSRKSVMVNQIHSLLCIPLAVSGAVIGALYLDSRVASGIFETKDKDFLVSVSKILASVIEKSQAFQHITDENILFKSRTIKEIGVGLVIGNSAAIRKVYNLAEKVSKTNTPVFLRGETGTGKGMLARYIHIKSKRKDNEFLTINCGAIPETLLESELFGHKKGAFTGAVADKEGLLEASAGGTVFLDEIANTSLEVQAKLLQAIEEKQIRRLGETKTRKIGVRFLFATNNHLEEDIKNGDFRKDLYYRINVISIRIPPLRECKKDIPMLARFFLKRYNAELNKNLKGITPGAMKKLREYNWPGNVRELQNVIERAVVLALGTHITSLEITLEPQMAKAIIPLKELEKKAIADALETNNWNVSKTAKQLGIGRVTLWRHIKEHRMQK